jgi:putative transposase
MSKPSRPSNPNHITGQSRIFFTTAKAANGKSLFQAERMANLLIDVPRSYVRSGKFIIHDFVVMPNHIHILMTVPEDISIEKAMQLIKGNFSFRAGRELDFRGKIWHANSQTFESTMSRAFGSIGNISIKIPSGVDL